MNSAFAVEEIGKMYSETITATLYPEAHQVPDRLAHIRVFPVEVWLLIDKQVKIILIRLLVVTPGRTFKSMRKSMTFANNDWWTKNLGI